MPEDKSKAEALKAVVTAIAAIPIALLSTPQGAALAAILIGTSMKAVGLGAPTLQLKAEFRGENFLRDVFAPKGLSEDEFCTQFPTSAAGAAYCEYGKSSLAIDTFPFDFKVAGIEVIKKEFGEISVPDMLISGGWMALTAEFWKGVIAGIGEIVPL